MRLGGSSDDLSDVAPKRLALTPAASETLPDEPEPTLPPGVESTQHQPEAPALDQPEPQQILSSVQVPVDTKPPPQHLQVRSPAVRAKEPSPPVPTVRSPAFPNQNEKQTELQATQATSTANAGVGESGEPPEVQTQPTGQGQDQETPSGQSKVSMYEDGSYWKCLGIYVLAFIHDLRMDRYVKAAKKAAMNQKQTAPPEVVKLWGTQGGRN